MHIQPALARAWKEPWRAALPEAVRLAQVLKRVWVRAQTAVLYSKFVDPALSQKMEQDEKQRELVIVGSTVRGRIFARVEGHILGNPETRVAMLGTTGELDASEEAAETAALVAGRV